MSPWQEPVSDSQHPLYHSTGCYFNLLRHPEKSIDRWAKQYGGLYSFFVGDQRFVILSDPHVVKNLLVLQGSIFWSRKEYFIKIRTIMHHRAATGTPYNATWKKHRRTSARLLIPRAVATYSTQLEFEARDMVRQLLVDGKASTSAINPRPYLSSCALNHMLPLTFGFRTERFDEPVVAEPLRISRIFIHICVWAFPPAGVPLTEAIVVARELTSPVANLFDFLSVPQKLPSAIKRRARELTLLMRAGSGRRGAHPARRARLELR
ncbi:cytochrome P450 [Earliella scabrosa]|nr:cytochrome P450 [Earliella scabrosa]